MPMTRETVALEPFYGNIPGVRDGKIYNDADSKDVEKYVLFVAGDANQGVYAYKDQACTEKVTYDELQNMFVKGVVVAYGFHDDNTNLDCINYVVPSSFFTYAGFHAETGEPIKVGVLGCSELGAEITSAEFADMRK